MVTPLAPYRAVPSGDDDAGLPATARRSGPPLDPTTLPDHSGSSASLVARAVRAATAGPPPPTQAQIQQRLDAFLQSTTVTLHTPEGTATTSMPFRMPAPLRSGDAFARQEAVVASNQSARLRAEAAVGLAGEDGALMGGRATPQQIRAVAQALIDQGGLPPPDGVSSLQARVRVMMANHGLGMDCAGYAQQAILAATGLTRAQAGLKADAKVEDLTNVERQGFARVDLAQARPGDLIVVGPLPQDGLGPNQVGHNVVIRDVGYATPAELSSLSKGFGAKLDPEAVARFTVDGSWGSGANANAGGVERRAWFRDEVSGAWLVPDGPRVQSSSTPCAGHAVADVFRPKDRP